MGRTFGKYELVERIAEGGMGEVFLARQQGIQGFEKRVVVKTLLPHLARNTDFVHMFLDEARIAAQLSHPNLVSIFDLGEQDGTYFLAMDYVHGETFSALLRRLRDSGKKLDPALACRVVAEAAAGLAYAHALPADDGKPLGLVHRDVSPQNILVGFDGSVKLIDFGVARARGRLTQTDTGVVKGKWAYMSPEQAGGDAVDGRSDLFSLGVVLWEALVGQFLFRADTEAATLSAVMSRRIAPPSEVARDVPPSLDAVVLGALEREPGKRYKNLEEFRLALENWLARSGSPASTAHLSSLMRSAFPDRAQLRPISLPPALELLPATPAPGDKTRNDRATQPETVQKPVSSGLVFAVLLVAAVAVAGALSLFGGEPAVTASPASPSMPTARPVEPEREPVVAPPAPVEPKVEPPPAAQAPVKAEPAKPPTPAPLFPRCQPKENCLSTLEPAGSARRIEPIRVTIPAELVMERALALVHKRPNTKILKQTATRFSTEYVQKAMLFTSHSEIVFDPSAQLLHIRLSTDKGGTGEIGRRWMAQFWTEMGEAMKAP